MVKKRKPGEPITLAWIRSNCVETDTGCWEWQGGRDGKGYGLIRKEGRLTKAHRIAFELNGGVLLHDNVCRHGCDNPPCANPDHLSSGTQLQNMQDMRDKGRSLIGEKHPGVKLTAETVRLIRNSPGSHVSKAEEFGTTADNVYAIMHGLSWTHVT